MTPKQKIDRVYGLLSRQNKVLDELRKTKDDGYRERNMIVAALTRLYPAYLAKHDAQDSTWHKEWMNIVYLDLPTGQVSWHLHDSDLNLFSHLEYRENNWDGHSTEEKYKIVLSLTK